MGTMERIMETARIGSRELGVIMVMTFMLLQNSFTYSEGYL